MFAVRDNRTGKYLKGFSGSLNHFKFATRWRLEKASSQVTSDDVHAALFCLDTPNGAKVYRNEAAVANSFYSYRYRAERRVSLQEACPWLEIVPIQMSVASKS